ncbi:MAG: PD-(D/E)XK nuclease family transposase [Bacteroidaceae bacterium]|nr:PD-(D/E)XK nuclease family transposase [Bacteroidaceae bacterium]
MVVENKYVRFDWAVKRMLRDKANFGVLEGLITVLLKEKVKIVDLLESKANQKQKDDEFYRVDIKATNSKDEIIFVEIALFDDPFYLSRILYGTSSSLFDDLPIVRQNVTRYYAIYILFHDFVGNCYHEGERNDIHYYVLIPKRYKGSWCITPLEEWLDYLKNGHIKDDTQTPGLSEAREKLQVMTMTPSERVAYDRHLDAIMVQEDVLTTAKIEGRAEGREEGREEGRKEGREEGLAKGREEGREEEKYDTARKMKADGMTVELIEKYTGLPVEVIISL